MAARFVWGGLTLVFLLGLFLSRSSKNTALNTEIQDAQTRATAYANTTITEAATIDARTGAITFVPKDFAVRLQAEVFTDPTVARVRVWDVDGTLDASTDVTEDVGGVVAADDPSLAAAVAGSTSAQIAEEPFTYSTVGSAPTGTQLLQVFVPLRARDQVDPAGAVQVDFLYDAFVSASASPWATLSRLFLILTVVCAVLFIVSMARRPVTAAERAATATVPATVSAPVASAEPVRDPEVDEELQAAREQLRQATEAFAFLEARMKDGSGTASASADVEAATSRITELESALNRAEAEAALARSSAVTQDDLDRVQHAADERVAELERRMSEPSPEAAAEAEALRARLTEAEDRAREAELALATAREDAAAEQDATAAEAAPAAPEAATPEPATKHEPVAKSETAPKPEPSDPNDLIAELEAQVAAAEARAKEAEDEALHLSPEANDLRARLARSAAKKKFGPSG
jgi:hypothetical protein